MSLMTIDDLRDSADAVLIVAHRGHRFGMVVENTLLAYDLALALGADILETDVARTRDGQYVIVHGPLLDALTDREGDVRHALSHDLKGVRLKTPYGLLDPAPMPTLENVLETYRKRALINVDRAYTLEDLEAVYQIAARMGMLDQILFKSPLPVDSVLPWLEAHGDRAAYMPIIRNDEAEMRRVLHAARSRRFPAVEITFAEENHPIFSRETVRTARSLGMKPLVNALTMKEPLCGGHDDVTSLLDGPASGWGWLIDRGAEMIQTDCTGDLKHYLSKRSTQR